MLQNKGTRHAGTQQSWASPSRTTCAPPCATAGRARRAPCEDGPRPSCPRPRSRCATRAASSRVLQTAEAALRASCTSRTPMAEMVAPPQGSDVFESHPRSQFGPICFYWLPPTTVSSWCHKAPIKLFGNHAHSLSRPQACPRCSRQLPPRTKTRFCWAWCTERGARAQGERARGWCACRTAWVACRVMTGRVGCWCGCVPGILSPSPPHTHTTTTLAKTLSAKSFVSIPRSSYSAIVSDGARLDFGR